MSTSNRCRRAVLDASLKDELHAPVHEMPGALLLVCVQMEGRGLHWINISVPFGDAHWRNVRVLYTTFQHIACLLCHSLKTDYCVLAPPENAFFFL